MVGAVVLSIATVALLNGLDGAQATGAKNKARSTAAALAEQDLERLRSLPVASLAAYGTQTRTVTVRGVNYTVKSTATWSVDSNGVISCSNISKTAANIRIVSEVSSPATQGIVDAASLVTPPPGTFGPNEGRAVVKVANSTGAPMSGVSVDLTGTASYSGTTNSLGCVVFPFIPAGPYTATLPGPLVDWQGNNPVTKGTSVTAGTSTQTTFEVDSPAEIRANFDTKVGSLAAAAAKSQWLTVSNGKLTVGSKVFEAIPAGAQNLLVTASGLFPFLDGYGVFAGNCAANNPALAPTSNQSFLQKFTPTPGQVLVTVPKVRMPSINVRVVNAAGTAVNGSAVYVKSADAGCSNLKQQTASTANSITGSLPEPWFPFGTYRICAEASTSGPHGHADVYAGAYDAKSTSTTAAETSTNRVDDAVLNTNPAGNSTSTTTNGAIRIRLNRSGRCELASRTLP